MIKLSFYHYGYIVIRTIAVGARFDLKITITVLLCTCYLMISVLHFNYVHFCIAYSIYVYAAGAAWLVSDHRRQMAIAGINNHRPNEQL